MIILIYSMPFLIYLCSSIFSTVLVINASKMGATPFFISMLGVSYGMGMMITAGIFSKIKIPKKILYQLNIYRSYNADDNICFMSYIYAY